MYFKVESRLNALHQFSARYIYIFFFQKGIGYIKYHFCPFSYDDKIQNEKFSSLNICYHTLTRGDLPFLAIIAPAMLECEVIQGLLGHIDLENVL